MRNKKAFTLVELLGVIVVLAILALITIPIISNVINDVRIKALRDSAYGLIEASNLYYVSKGSNTNLRFDKNEDKDTLKELSYKGVVKEGTVIISKKGEVTVCITDGKNSAYKNYNENKVTTSKGKCEIKGNSSIVYLDDEATISESNNNTLLERIEALENKIATLTTKDETSSLNSSLSNQISDVRNSQISLNDVYPVGSIYITVTEDTVAKVQAKFGGTWVSFGSGRTLVGVDTSQDEFNTVEKTGGEKMHALIESELPNITGSFQFGGGHIIVNENTDIFVNATGVFSTTVNSCGVYVQAINGIGYRNKNNKINFAFGGSQSHNNLQPYITVYMYKRTA